MSRHRTQSGFTAVELLITLFVAAAFLIAGYQLFNFVLKDGGDTRAQSRASNVAYDYMRRYSDSASNPCSPSTPITGQSISVDGLANATITITITCPESDAPTISKVNAIITYNMPQQTLQYATFVDKSKGATPNTDVTNGLVAWWPFNGNANSNVGPYNGTVYGATPSDGQNGQPNGAYSFSGAGDYISIPAGFTDLSNGFTISVWAKPTASSSFARFLDFGVGQANQNILFARTSTSNDLELDIANGANSFIGVVKTTSGPIVNNQWVLYTATMNSTGTMTIYKNGGVVATANGSLPLVVTRTSNFIGRSNWPSDSYYQGSMDDMRVYNRALSASEILQLFNNGAQ